MKNKFLLASLSTMFVFSFLTSCIVEPKFYKVYLDANGGTLVDGQMLGYFYSPSSPKKKWKNFSLTTKVSRKNYNFTGWSYKDSLIDDDYEISSDMLVIATWVKKSY